MPSLDTADTKTASPSASTEGATTGNTTAADTAASVADLPLPTDDQIIADLKSLAGWPDAWVTAWHVAELCGFDSGSAAADTLRRMARDNLISRRIDAESVTYCANK